MGIADHILPLGDLLCMFLYDGGIGVWLGVGRPCPPVRSNIMTRVTCSLVKIFFHLFLDHICPSNVFLTLSLFFGQQPQKADVPKDTVGYFQILILPSVNPP